MKLIMDCKNGIRVGYVGPSVVEQKGRVGMIPRPGSFYAPGAFWWGGTRSGRSPGKAEQLLPFSLPGPCLGWQTCRESES